jgi:hypothetical protein
VGGCKEKEIYLLFKMKVLTEFTFALFAKSTCCYLSGITKQECSSPRADPVRIAEHRLFVAGFSPQRHIFRMDISCVHRISSGLLIGSVAFSHSISSLPVPRPAGLQSSDPNSTFFCYFNTLAPMRITGGSHGNRFQYRERHRWVTGLYRLLEAQSSWSEIMYF